MLLSIHNKSPKVVILIAATSACQLCEEFDELCRLQGLVRASGVNLGTEVGSCCTSSGEVASEDWLNEGAKDNLGTTKASISNCITQSMKQTYPVAGRASQRTRTNLKV